MKKIVLFTCACLLMLSGCSKSYERDTSAGEIRFINYSDALQMMKNDETFLLMLTLPGCSHCEDMKVMLEEYLLDHHVIVYSAALVNDSGIELTTDQTKEHFPDFGGTPDTTFIENGEIEDSFSGFMSESKFDTFVVDNQLDKKK